MLGHRRITIPDLGRLPAFCHATVHGSVIYVSGTLGSVGDTFELVDGGVGPETRQTLRNIEKILVGCGAGLDDVLKVNVFLADMEDFAAMNEAYLTVLGDDPPARITVGGVDLALGARVEIDCIAAAPAKRISVTTRRGKRGGGAGRGE